MKYMSDKPINTLSGDQWLKLVEAEKAKLLEINLASDIGSFPKGKTFFQDVLEFFQYEAFSDMVKKWNALRKECLEHAFYKILYPMFRVEIRNKLTREAKGKHHTIVLHTDLGSIIGFFDCGYSTVWICWEFSCHSDFS